MDLRIVDRDAWLEKELKGQDFMLLDSERKKYICTNLKREPLLDFIRSNSFKIWISAIRKDQTQSRSAIEFMEVTDLNAIKLCPLHAWTKPEAGELILSHKLLVNNEYLDLCKLNESKECGLHY